MFDLVEDFSQRLKNLSHNPDLPIAAALYDEHKRLLSFKVNAKEREQVAYYHAEILAIQEASLLQGNWRLTGCSLVTNLFPCDLCLEALHESRIEKVYFLAYRKSRPKKSYCFQLIGGFFHEQEEKKLKNFFSSLRESCPSGLRSTLGKRV